MYYAYRQKFQTQFEGLSTSPLVIPLEYRPSRNRLSMGASHRLKTMTLSFTISFRTVPGQSISTFYNLDIFSDFIIKLYQFSKIYAWAMVNQTNELMSV